MGKRTRWKYKKVESTWTWTTNADINQSNVVLSNQSYKNKNYTTEKHVAKNMKSQETHCSLNKFEKTVLLYPAHPHFPAPKIRPCRYFHCWQMARRLPRGEGGRKNCFEPLSKLLETYFRAKNEDKHSLGGEIENWSGCAEMFNFCLLTKGVDLEALLVFSMVFEAHIMYDMWTIKDRRLYIIKMHLPTETLTRKVFAGQGSETEMDYN